MIYQKHAKFFYLLALPAILTLSIACNEQQFRGDSANNGPGKEQASQTKTSNIGETVIDPRSDDDKKDLDATVDIDNQDEDETATFPSNITGAFLSCHRESGSTKEGSIKVGCALFSDKGKVDDKDGAFKWSYSEAPDNLTVTMTASTDEKYHRMFALGGASQQILEAGLEVLKINVSAQKDSEQEAQPIAQSLISDATDNLTEDTQPQPPPAPAVSLCSPAGSSQGACYQASDGNTNCINTCQRIGKVFDPEGARALLNGPSCQQTLIALFPDAPDLTPRQIFDFISNKQGVDPGACFRDGNEAIFRAGDPDGDVMLIGFPLACGCR